MACSPFRKKQEEFMELVLNMTLFTESTRGSQAMASGKTGVQISLVAVCCSGGTQASFIS